MYFSIDRIVSGRAMLIDEDKKPLEVPADMLPAGAKEGDMLFYAKGKFALDAKKTAERRERVGETLAMLLRARDNGQDTEN